MKIGLVVHFETEKPETRTFVIFIQSNLGIAMTTGYTVKLS